MNLGTARDLFEGYDGTEKDSLMQTEIVLREKLETLKRPPWYKFISLPSLPLPLKSKMAVIIFVMKLLSTRSPKLGLLCRLKMEKK